MVTCGLSGAAGAAQVYAQRPNRPNVLNSSSVDGACWAAADVAARKASTDTVALRMTQLHRTVSSTITRRTASAIANVACHICQLSRGLTVRISVWRPQLRR